MLSQLDFSDPWCRMFYLQFLLIAAHLNRDNVDEWLHLAEMSVENKRLNQAISCYDRGMSVTVRCLGGVCFV